MLQHQALIMSVGILAASAAVAQGSGALASHSPASEARGAEGAVPIGTPLLLRADDRREVIEAVVTRLLQRPLDSGTRTGGRRVAVGLQLKNRSDKVFSSCPLLTATVTDTRGRSAEWQLFGEQPDLGCVRIRPGKAVFGYITYGLRSSRPALFTYSVRFFGGGTGKWDLRTH